MIHFFCVRIRKYTKKIKKRYCAQTAGPVEKPLCDENEGKNGCFRFLFSQESPDGSENAFNIFFGLPKNMGHGGISGDFILNPDLNKKPKESIKSFNIG